jgi:hypothetical protein
MVDKEAGPHLSAVINKGNLHTVLGALCDSVDLCRKPALFFIWEPDTGPLGIVFCHCRGEVKVGNQFTYELGLLSLAPRHV